MNDTPEPQPENHLAKLSPDELRRIAERAMRNGTGLSALPAQRAYEELERRENSDESTEEGVDTKQERRTNRY